MRGVQECDSEEVRDDRSPQGAPGAQLTGLFLEEAVRRSKAGQRMIPIHERTGFGCGR
jgi:hypothetical protein